MSNEILYCSFRRLSDVFTFGAYKGQTLSDVIDSGSRYLEWCMKEMPGLLLYDEAMDEIRKIYPNLHFSEAFEAKRLQNLDDDCPDNDYDDCEPCGWEEDEPTYDRYRGSWAQDEMGYSDDDIETIFDGDPDAYWNID